MSLTPDKVKFIAIHCAATPPQADIGAKEIDGWHKARGWSGIGYHFVIRRNGVVETGRPLNQIGSHVQGFNAVSLGICLVGGVKADGRTPENNFTPAQFASLAKLVKDLKVTYKDAVVQGHRDFPRVAKACPCFDVKPWWKGVENTP